MYLNIGEMANSFSLTSSKVRYIVSKGVNYELGECSGAHPVFFKRQSYHGYQRMVRHIYNSMVIYCLDMGISYVRKNLLYDESGGKEHATRMVRRK